MQIPPDKILRLRDVLERTGLKRSTIYRLIQDQEFPKPIRLSIRSVGWLQSEVDAWIEQRVASSRKN